MTWKQLLNARNVKAHTTSRQELDALRAVIERDIEDSSISGLSADRSFATAYNAALQTSKMAIACAGYRVVATKGHHQVSFQAAELALGPNVARLLVYFDMCRRKRNTVDYDLADVVSDTEAEELLREARAFKNLVETWISVNYPDLAQ